MSVSVYEADQLECCANLAQAQNNFTASSKPVSQATVLTLSKSATVAFLIDDEKSSIGFKATWLL